MKVEGFPTTNGSRWVDPQRAPTIEPPPDLWTNKKGLKSILYLQKFLKTIETRKNNFLKKTSIF